MTLRTLSAGFIPLVDAAPLIVARELGFAEKHGVDLQLTRSNSWAGLRDRLSVGNVDAAHMLPPIAIASQLGIGNPKAPMVVPCGLSMNGNAISVSNQLFEAMLATGWRKEQVRDPMASAKAMAEIVLARRSAGESPLTFASVYPFSPHSYELRYWLAAAGINPDEDVSLTIVPPPMVADAMKEGHIDGFCVGAPWNSLSAQAGFSHIIAYKVDIWGQGPEKVLAVREEWALQNDETTLLLVRLLFDAAGWCADPANLSALAQLLSDPNYLDMDAGLIAGSLTGELSGELPDADQAPVKNHLLFDPSVASYPWRSHALWFYAQMVRWGQIKHGADQVEAAKKSYRPDIYRLAMADESALGTVTRTNASPGGFLTASDGGKADTTLFDQRLFDPDDLDGYLASFGSLKD